MLKSFLQELYPDELWYSIIARYHFESGNFHILDTMEDLFEERRVPIFNICLASNLSKPQSLAPPGVISCERIIKDHTLAAFFSRNDADIMGKLMHYCEIRNNRHPSYSFGFINGYSLALRYCPLCQQEDRVKYGEPYWHKEHQISFIPYCIHHHCKLYEAPIPKNDFLAARNLVRPQTKVIPAPTTFPYESLVRELLYNPEILSFTEDDILYAMEKAGYTEKVPFTLRVDDLLNDIQKDIGDYKFLHPFDLQWLSRRKRCISNETWLILLGFLKDFMTHNTESFCRWYSKNYGLINKHRKNK